MPFSIPFRSLAPAALARVIVLCGIAGGLTSYPAACPAGERWTSLDGSKTVEAEFVGVWGNNVVLELAGPKRITVSMDDLIAESRIQARRMGEDQQQRRGERRQQILADAKEAAAPAPNPLPKPPEPPAYQSLNAGGGLLAQLEWLDQQNTNGHGLIAAFDSLPPTYQDDLERMLRSSVAKLDLQGMGQILGSVHSIGDLVVTRQRWLFSHPRLAVIDPDAKEALKGALLSIAGLIRDGIDPEQLKLEDLATTPLRNWLVELDQRLAPHIASMNDQFELMGIESSGYEVKEEKGGKATVEVTSGELKQTVNFITVSGMWMPADSTEEQWAEAMAKWQTTLDETEDGSLLAGGVAQMVPMFIDPVLQPAVAATSARDFHAAMDGWFTMASPLIAQMGSMNLGTGGRRGGNSYGSGYGGMDDYEMEMDMEMDMEMEMEMEMEMDEQ